MKGKYSHFWAGVLFACCTISLYQDYLGREAYAQHVLDNWVSMYYTVPMAIVMLLLVAWITWGCDAMIRRQLRVPGSK